ncbi:hypothetical protein AB832_07920 [Flavobacteriaceae bacterium (ex Bugula neritina AB1)]|nr:hypothetical protein AB832_07920 [Flavobacteriaceae bacterium (ex Bugula neritina AB1)]
MRKFGSLRVVYLIGGLAFKFPTISSWEHFLRGLLANMEEVHLWKNRSNVEFGFLLCPVRFSLPFGLLVVMKRAKVMTDEDFLDREEEIKTLTNAELFTPKVGNPFVFNSIGELKPSSWGFIDNKIIVVDYGN